MRYIKYAFWTVVGIFVILSAGHVATQFLTLLARQLATGE